LININIGMSIDSYIGLIYNNLSTSSETKFSHIKYFKNTHYSELTEPIINTHKLLNL